MSMCARWFADDASVEAMEHDKAGKARLETHEKKRKAKQETEKVKPKLIKGQRKKDLSVVCSGC